MGSAELTGRQVVQAIYPELIPQEGAPVDASRAVIGLKTGQSFERASCCQPLPDERIVGISMRGRGVVVHTIDCEQLIKLEDRADDWLDLRWHDGSHAAVYTATLRMTIGNGAGVLGRVCSLIGETGANISDLQFMDRKPDYFLLLIDVDLRDVQHLHTLMGALNAQEEVAAIERYRNIDIPDANFAPSG